MKQGEGAGTSGLKDSAFWESRRAEKKDEAPTTSGLGESTRFGKSKCGEKRGDGAETSCLGYSVTFDESIRGERFAEGAENSSRLTLVSSFGVSVISSFV